MQCKECYHAQLKVVHVTSSLLDLQLLAWLPAAAVDCSEPVQTLGYGPSTADNSHSHQ